MAIASGAITGAIIRLPIIEQIKESEEFYEDEPFWEIPGESESLEESEHTRVVTLV